MILAVVFMDPAYAASAFTKNAKKITVGSQVLYQFEATVDSVDTLTSANFSIAGADDDSFSTYPIPYGHMKSSATDSAFIAMVVYGSYNASNWFIVDTVGTFNDSVQTFQKGTQDWNNIKCPYYRVAFMGLTGNESDAAIKLYLWIYRRD